MKKNDTEEWHIDDLIKECEAKKGFKSIDIGLDLPICPYINRANQDKFYCRYMGHRIDTRITCVYKLIGEKND